MNLRHLHRSSTKKEDKDSYLLPAQGKKKKEGASDKASEDLTLAQQWRVFAKDKSGTELAGFDNLQHSSRQKAEA